VQNVNEFALGQVLRHPRPSPRGSRRLPSRDEFRRLPGNRGAVDVCTWSVCEGLAVGAIPLSTSALPSDLPVKAQPIAAYDWTGFYVGANAGHGTTRTTTINEPDNPDAWPSGGISLKRLPINSDDLRNDAAF
jgi:hypothetical protein